MILPLLPGETFLFPPGITVLIKWTKPSQQGHMLNTFGLDSWLSTLPHAGINADQPSLPGPKTRPMFSYMANGKQVTIAQLQACLVPILAKLQTAMGLNAKDFGFHDF